MPKRPILRTPAQPASPQQQPRALRRGALALLVCAGCTVTVPCAAAGPSMQTVGDFEIDRTEVTVGDFRRFVDATGLQTQAERAGGGRTYEAGWEQRAGWVWHSPYGVPAQDDEPVVHVTHAEAAAYCAWAGKRLLSEAEWRTAAYTETRVSPPAGFERGHTYDYPTGRTPEGANCLGDCGDSVRPVSHAVTSRGRGHAPAGTSRAGVNGLHDMGANVWEWAVGEDEAGTQPTMGGSWWYGAAQMHREHRAGKPADTAVVYIGFRCARSR